MALLPHRRIIIHAIVLSILLLPVVTWGQSVEEKASKNFIPLVGIPYIEGNKVQTFGDYVNALYFAAISIAAFLAVVRIIFAGVKYMLSDIVTTKEEARKEIKGALIGLLIVIGAVLILDTINPNLKTIRVFSDAPVPQIGLEDNRPKPPPSPCEIDPKSAACCKEKGGETYAVSTSTNQAGFICSMGKVVNDEEYNTGDEFNDKFSCERDGYEWDATLKKCRQPGETIMPIPASSVGAERLYCSGINAKYDEDRNVCVMID